MGAVLLLHLLQHQLLLLLQHQRPSLDLRTTVHLLARLMRLRMTWWMRMALKSVPSAMPSATLMPIARAILQEALPSLDASSRIRTLVRRRAAFSAASSVEIAQMVLRAAAL